MYVKTINTVTKEKWGREIVNMYFKWNLSLIENCSYNSTVEILEYLF